MFDNYISLGENCEAAFQIRRILGRDSSSFFSWNVTSFEALQSLLASDFAGVMMIENFSTHADGSLLRDASHDYLFHSPFDKDWQADPKLDEKLVQLKSKFAYFIEKFHSLPSQGQTAFFYKSLDEGDVRTKAREIASVLDGIFPEGNYMLVVAQEAGRQEADWGEARIRNRYLSRLAPWFDATDGHVHSWDRIFQEFPAKEPLRLAGY